jgi:hypothetical protein
MSPQPAKQIAPRIIPNVAVACLVITASLSSLNLRLECSVNSPSNGRNILLGRYHGWREGGNDPVAVFLFMLQRRRTTPDKQIA